MEQLWRREKENMKEMIGILIIAMASVMGEHLSETCARQESSVIYCNCVENKEFVPPTDFNFLNLTSLVIESCTSANIESTTLMNLKLIHDIHIQNISGKLIFEPKLFMRNFGKIWLRNIKIIPAIGPKTFSHMAKIDSFIIENARINYFSEQFTDINVKMIILDNVTIESMVGINWSGHSLKIINTKMRNVNGDLNFESVDSIIMINSTIEFSKSGQMSIYGSNVKIINCIFSNISINSVAGSVVISDNCGDGMSSLRLSSDWIKSTNNRMPTGIIYTNNRSNSNMSTNINNKVCKAGNCKCRKNSEHNCHHRFHANIYLGIILPLILFSL